MAFADYDPVADNNTTIAGFNIAEGCPPGNLNNVMREFAAAARTEHDNLPSTATLMPKDGGTFSGTQPIFSGQGAFVHHNNSSNASGRIFVQASGGSVPSMLNGDFLFEF